MPAEGGAGAAARPHRDWIVPEALPAGLGAMMTTRAGGVSAAPWDTMNLGAEVGDSVEAVTANRRRFAEAAGATPVFLRQVHGTRVARVGMAVTESGANVVEADAAVTNQPGVACAVQVADCLPVLLAAPGARGVAAAHAGWRGLAGGVLEAAVQSLCALAECHAGELWVWLGPSIGPRRFEVGADVVQAFGRDPARQSLHGFRAAPAQLGVPKWRADLPLLARERLLGAGVSAVHGGVWCTVEEGARFFSFRRDRVTGRMAAAIWITR